MRDFFERYGQRIDRGGDGGCWLWRGAVASIGYGHFNRDRRHHYAHRAAFESRVGEGAASGLVVRHKCDNPRCCNPDHLEVGTQADNVADMFKRGRQNTARGESSSKARLTEAQVIEARRLAADGQPIARIIERFPVRHHTMHAAITGATWSHLPGAVAAVTKADPVPPPRKSPEEAGRLLDPVKVRAIRAALAAGQTGRAIAADYGISPVTVSAIKVGRIWSDVA